VVGSVDTPGDALGVAVSGNHAYVADNASGLQVIDITNPAHPQIVGSVGTFDSAVEVAVSGSYAYVAAVGYFLVIDITDPAHPQVVGSAPTPMGASSVVIAGTCAFVSTGERCVKVIDITNPAQPQEVGGRFTLGWTGGVSVAGAHAYVTAGRAGIEILDITNPASPRFVGSVNTPGDAYGVVVSGGYAYVADAFSGLQILPVQCEEPQAVYLLRFHAARRSGGAAVHWELAHPRDDSGFNVWREAPGSVRIRVSQALLGGRQEYDFVDPTPPPTAAEYWLQEVAADGRENWYGPAYLDAAPIPTALRLGQNQPNPFNPRTTFSFSLPKSGRVLLGIYDVRGAQIATIFDADTSAGEQTAEWGGLDDQGVAAPSGVYFARLETAAGVRTVKVMLAR
jgi:hypothetical protein